MSFCSSTSTASLHSRPSFTADSARYAGVHTFAGKLPRSRASAMPAAIARPSRMPRSKAAVSRLDAAEAVGDVGGRQYQLARLPCRVAVWNLQLGEIEARVPRPRAVNGGERGAGTVAILLLSEFFFLPETHQQHALRGNAVHVIQKPCISYLAVHVSGAEKFADLAARGLVEGIRGRRQPARFEYARGDARARPLLRCREFCVKFHSASIRGTRRDYLRFASPKSKQHGAFPTLYPTRFHDFDQFAK